RGRNSRASASARRTAAKSMTLVDDKSSSAPRARCWRSLMASPSSDADQRVGIVDASKDGLPLGDGAATLGRSDVDPNAADGATAGRDRTRARAQFEPLDFPHLEVPCGFG